MFWYKSVQVQTTVQTKLQTREEEQDEVCGLVGPARKAQKRTGQRTGDAASRQSFAINPAINLTSVFLTCISCPPLPQNNVEESGPRLQTFFSKFGRGLPNIVLGGRAEGGHEMHVKKTEVKFVAVM